MLIHYQVFIHNTGMICISDINAAIYKITKVISGIKKVYMLVLYYSLQIRHSCKFVSFNEQQQTGIFIQPQPF